MREDKPLHRKVLPLSIHLIITLGLGHAALHVICKPKTIYVKIPNTVKPSLPLSHLMTYLDLQNFLEEDTTHANRRKTVILTTPLWAKSFFTADYVISNSIFVQRDACHKRESSEYNCVKTCVRIWYMKIPRMYPISIENYCSQSNPDLFISDWFLQSVKYNSNLYSFHHSVIFLLFWPMMWFNTHDKKLFTKLPIFFTKDEETVPVSL